MVDKREVGGVPWIVDSCEKRAQLLLREVARQACQQACKVPRGLGMEDAVVREAGTMAPEADRLDEERMVHEDR